MDSFRSLESRVRRGWWAGATGMARGGSHPGQRRSVASIFPVAAVSSPRGRFGRQRLAGALSALFEFGSEAQIALPGGPTDTRNAAECGRMHLGADGTLIENGAFGVVAERTREKMESISPHRSNSVTQRTRSGIRSNHFAMGSTGKGAGFVALAGVATFACSRTSSSISGSALRSAESVRSGVEWPRMAPACGRIRDQGQHLLRAYDHAPTVDKPIGFS
jgi:hypothetical protein